MRDIVRQVARGIVIGLAIAGAIFILLVVPAAAPSLYHAWSEQVAPDTLLCRNHDFDQSDPSSREFVPCPER